MLEFGETDRNEDELSELVRIQIAFRQARLVAKTIILSHLST